MKKNNKVITEKPFPNMASPMCVWHFQHATDIEQNIEAKST